MIIYEVNLQISREIIQPYLEWLAPHVQKMLQFPGFMDVVYLQEQVTDDAAFIGLTLQYQIENNASLQHYLDHHAHKMREEAQKFSGKFSATRRVFTTMSIDHLRLSYTE